MADIFGRKEGNTADLEQAIANREAGKHADEETCSCNLARKATDFSALLSNRLMELEACRTAKTAVAADAQLPANETDGKQCSADGVPSAGFTGERLTFLVQAVQKTGEKQRAGGDQLWWGRLASSQAEPANQSRRIELRFEDLSDGTYEASFVVFVPGEYSIEVQHDDSAVAGSPFRLNITDEPPAGEGEGAQGEVAASAANLPTGVPREQMPICTDIATSFSFGEWAGVQWNPNACSLPADSHEKADAALANKRVWFVGDSLIRCQFWAFTTWMVQMNEYTLKSDGMLLENKNANKTLKYASGDGGSYHQLLGHFGGFGYRYEVHLAKTNTTIAYHVGWNSAFQVGACLGNLPCVCSACTRLAFQVYNMSFLPGDNNQQPGYLSGALVREMPAFTKNSAYWLQAAQPDVLVLSVAAHDMIADDLAAFARNVHGSLRNIRARWRYKGKLIWVGGSAPVPSKQGVNFEHYKLLQTFAKCERYDAALVPVLQRWGVDFLRTYPMTKAVPELSYDGMHYVLSEDVLDDPVYMMGRRALLGIMGAA
jgi:hypothetical protein